MKLVCTIHRNAGMALLLGCFSVFFVACRKTDLVPAEPHATVDAAPWQKMLQELEPESNIILVQRGSSIQEVLDKAHSGDAIFVEPGIYQEALSINGPDIRLVGLTGPNKEPVILENPGTGGKAVQLANYASDRSVSGIVTRGFNESGWNSHANAPGQQKKNNCLIEVKREQLGGGIAHYVFLLRVGSQPYDVVRLHRVVAEKRPWHPVHAQGNLFMIHGARQDFDDVFLTAGSNLHTPQTSSPVFLASKNIDVWGIDLAWNLVTSATTDFSFMKDWDIEKDIDHTLKAMAFARLVRALTHQGFRPMNLLGFSYGVRVAYGAAGRETQQPRPWRDIDGLVIAEGGIKYAPGDNELRINACNRAQATRQQIDGGTYANMPGAPLAALAAAAPDDPSPFPPFAGLTNKQALLFIATTIYATGNPPAPFWHFLGGTINGLNYTDYDRWLALTSTPDTYQSLRTSYESDACYCNEEDVSFDDNLDKIRVPIFYLGVGGAFGEHGLYSTSLTGSTDISHYIVHIPGAERAQDFGHADLFMARDAPMLAWEPLGRWVLSHR